MTLDHVLGLSSAARGGAMDLSDFDALFERLTGREPYPWQRRLYRRFMGLSGASRVLPHRLDLPTGLGKTSVMAVWLAARINGADLPRRLVYVVDRRAVVDQATAEAERLACKLDGLIKGEHADLILRNLRLRPVLADDKAAPAALPISTLRGQFLDNRRWIDDPASAAIVVGTVDMIGSRLLFSGYGVSRWMRPVHAALLGVDSLVLLDEAHLAAPFEAMLRSAAALVARDVQATGEPRPAALKALSVLSLSATGAERAGEDVFRLEAEDWADDRTKARLSAPKSVRLEPEATPAKLVERLTDLAWSLRRGEEGAARRVVVFCNSRTTAQKVEEALSARARGKEGYGKDARLTALLVGERRFREREELARGPLFRRFLAAEPQIATDTPAFLVATSAGEVGVDLDADDLVCDLVAWERMVQRFGRVNRRAEPGSARVHVVPVAGEKEAEEGVDAERLKRLRAPFDCGLWDAAPDGGLDASPAGLLELRKRVGSGEALVEATTPEPLRPPLTRAVVEAWSLTSLEAHTGRPKVDPWLRGWVEREPQTRVVWRRWLPLREGEIRRTPELKAYLEEHAAPHVSEILEAPSWRVADLLRERAKAVMKGVGAGDADAEAGAEAAEPDETEGPRPLHPIVVVRLSADGELKDVYDITELQRFKPDQLVRELSEATVVVDARLGGLSPVGLLDGKAAALPMTVDAETGWGFDLDKPTGWRVCVGDKAPKATPERGGRWALSAFRWASSEQDTAWGLWVQDWRGGGRNAGDPAIARQAQTLQEHHAWAAREMGRIAEALGLSPAYTAMLVAAVGAHDLGKARRIWQDAMGARRDDGRPYAKTEGGANGRALEGYRHEFGSLNDVLAAPDVHLNDVEPALRDLALHLIAAHHGRSRPLVNALDPDQRPDLSAPVAQAAALRFAALQGEWGPWGLAWWEALLRAADWAASGALNLLEPPEAEAAKADVAELAHG